MNKPSSLDRKLHRLGLLARDLPSQTARDEFAKVLLGANNILIARAAQLIARAGDRELIPVLIEAFTRLLDTPAAFDKGCRAKSAVIQALDDLGYEGTEPFLLGLYFKQMERVYGEPGPIDTAGDLRATCAVMLANRYHPDIRFEMARLLVDSERSPRLAAVGVLSCLGDEASELLLRLKALTPEQDPPVIHKCFSGLLTCNLERSWPFVADFLGSENLLLAESAAIAIGETHDQRAFPALRKAWEDNANMEIKSTLLLAMALSRSDEAIDYLVGMVKNESASAATQALQALSIYSSDEQLRQRIQEAAASRQDVRILEAFHRGFAE